MDLAFLQNIYISIILGICLCVGYIIKTSLNFIPNKYIPLILAIIGVVANIWVNSGFTAEIISGGMISGLGSTGLYEMFRNLIEKNNINDK